MVDDTNPHIIGITESWVNNDITDVELLLEGCAVFRKDIMGRRGGECYYTSRQLYQHMKCSYRSRLQLGHVVQTSYRTYNSYRWRSRPISMVVPT